MKTLYFIIATLFCSFALGETVFETAAGFRKTIPEEQPVRFNRQGVFNGTFRWMDHFFSDDKMKVASHFYDFEAKNLQKLGTIMRAIVVSDRLWDDGATYTIYLKQKIFVVTGLDPNHVEGSPREVAGAGAFWLKFCPSRIAELSESVLGVEKECGGTRDITNPRSCIAEASITIRPADRCPNLELRFGVMNANYVSFAPLEMTVVKVGD